MEELLKEQFGFQEVSLKKLNGYENCNYLLESEGDKYIFKTYLYAESLIDLIEAENETLLFLQKTSPSFYPKPIKFESGKFIDTFIIDDKRTICRLLSYLEGDFAGDVEMDTKYLKSLGVFLANTNILLQSFNDYILRARTLEWDLKNALLNRKYLLDIPDTKDRKIVSYFFNQFEEKVIPVLPSLRKQIIHNDANEWNVLVKDGEVSGIIDFGDLVYAPLINELAIAITYACYDKENPLNFACQILKAYNEILLIEEKEIEILYYLIAGRLCTSVCHSAHSRIANPENKYATSSEKFAWSMLYKWIRINPLKAVKRFKESIGLFVAKNKNIEEAIGERHKHISPLLSISYKKPIHMNQAAFQYMYDADGNTFLDAYNNIPHVGHSHPKVVVAGQKQMAKLNTNTRYLYDLLPAYTERLLSKFPKPLNKVFLVNSGSAASDLAIRMALAHTGFNQLMVMEHGYHGNTQIGIDISDYKFNNPKGQGQKQYILKTPIPDRFNGKFKGANAGELYAQEAIEGIHNSNHKIAAFIAEPIVGCGGQVPLAKGYLKHMYPEIRKQGGVCISDEVQTGFGRLGSHFWGFETQGVVPDMVILGKPMGNGHPIAGVVTTDEIAASFAKGVEFFSSFGGNPVSCAIGLSVLEVLEEENLQENALEVGTYFKSLLMNLQNKHDAIGDVRGEGLFLGVELINPKTRKPNTELAYFIKNELRNNHILVSTDGPYNNVIKMKPPLCFTKENSKEVVEAIDKALNKKHK